MGAALVAVAAVGCVVVAALAWRSVVGHRLEHAFDDLRPLGPMAALGAGPSDDDGGRRCRASPARSRDDEPRATSSPMSKAS